MEKTSSPGSQRPPFRPPSPAKNASVDETVLPAPPPTRPSEINITYEISTPDNCILCLSDSCNQHGQIRSSYEFLELPEIPVSTGHPDDKSEVNTSGEFPVTALQNSFFDESEDDTDSPSDEDDEIPEDGPASSDSESEENEIEPEIENAEAQYPRVPRGRLNHRVPRGRPQNL